MMEFIASIWTAFRTMVPTLTGQILLALGLATGTTTGVSLLMDWCKAQLLSGINGLPATTVQLLAMMHVGTCISMIFGAISARLLLKGLQSTAGGAIKRMFWM